MIIIARYFPPGDLIGKAFQITLLITFFVSMNACTYIKKTLASSASSASIGSISASSGSSAISESVQSIISSPSKHFPIDDGYSREVANYTHTFVTFPAAKHDYNLFKQGIGKIALRNGIIDWENNPKTYQAIGRGLKKAGLKGKELETYKKELAGADFARMRDIQKGYDTE